jgi:hypothetical protein
LLPDPIGPKEAFALAVLGAWAALFVKSWLGIRRTPVVEPRPTTPPAQVTAFVPARDEAGVIGRSTAALLAEARAGALARVAVIDDASSDATPQILRQLAEGAPELQLLTGHGPRPGECGKPAALRDAVHADRPSTAWLMFVDADVVLAPGAVGGLLATAEAQQADLVTIFPEVELGTALERVVMPAVGALIAARYPPARIADPGSRRAFANGQLILVRRALYEAAGGHAAVVAEILEDTRLAERVKAAGGRICVADGRAIARTRMYESWPELVEGWSKNLYLLMDRSPALTFGWAAASLAIGWAGILALVLAPFPLGLIAWAGVAGMQASLRAAGGAAPGWALLAPLGSLALAYLLVRSMLLHRRRSGIRWKGRAY